MYRTFVPTLKIPILSLISSDINYRKESSLINSQTSLSNYEQLCFKLIFIEDGKGWHNFSYHQTPIMPGDLLIIPPGEVYKPKDLNHTKSWIIIFNADILALNFNNDGLLLFPFLQSKTSKLSHFFVVSTEHPRWIMRLQDLQRELNNRCRGFENSASAILSLLLIDTVRIADTQLKKSLIQSKLLVKQVFQFIEANYRQRIGLSDVAQFLNISPSYLTDFVRRHTGKTVLSWIIERKMMAARCLLLTTNQRIYQVAEATGYSDTGHFIRKFRQHHNNTPQEWRQLYQNQPE